jgi:hypothetical protein
MSEQPSTSLATDAEIEAALAEATTEEIPSLDDGTGQTIIPVPVQGPAFRPMPDRDATQGGARDSAADSNKSLAKDAPTAVAPRKSARIGRLLYRCADTLLWAVNRPFGWLPLGARRLTGAIAIVTLMISLLAPYVLPLLSPPRHPGARTISAPHDSVKSGPHGSPSSH